MDRVWTPAGLLAGVLAVAGQATGQPVAPRLVGAGGPGLQPQINTSPYRAAYVAPASGVNTFAQPPATPTLPGIVSLPRRGTPPAVPPAAAVAPKNAMVFNPGFVPPFPLALRPPTAPPVPRGAFNPVLVARPVVASAYYQPPVDGRPAELSTTDETADGPGFVLPTGELHFLPWMW